LIKSLKAGNEAALLWKKTPEQSLADPDKAIRLEQRELQKDAELYKWLRNNPSNSNLWCVKGANGVSNDPIDSSQLDDAVDEAMRNYFKD
jgi:hypothetical protein